MRYYNQTNYPHVPYPTLTDLPELGRSDTTVRDAGCGLCASCMVVENMTGREFPLIDCLELSINVNANHSPGTDLTVLGPYIAERFDLDLVITDDPELLRAHLKKGYMAVACSAGDRPEEDYIGVFSHGGHFIAVVGIEEDGEHITVLDPSLMPDKYQEDGRRDKVIVNGNVLHTEKSNTMQTATSRNGWSRKNRMPTKTVTSFSALKHPRADKPNQYHQFWRMICTKLCRGSIRLSFSHAG